jgi:hypothetical protein
MGTTQLLSVPYALYAANSGNTTTIPNLESVISQSNSANNQQIKDLQDPTEAQDAVTKNYTYSKVVVDALIAAAVNNLHIQINENLNLLEFLKGKVYRKDIPNGVKYVHFDLSFVDESYTAEERYEGWSFYEILNDNPDEQGCFLTGLPVTYNNYSLVLNPAINSPTEFSFDAVFGQSFTVTKSSDDTISIFNFNIDDGYTEVAIEEFIELDCLQAF